MAIHCEKEKTVTVHVIFMGELSRWADKREIEVELPEGSTVQTLAKDLGLLCGESFARHVLTRDGLLQPHVAVFVNGAQIGRLDGTQTILTGGKVELMLVAGYEGG